MPVKRIVAWRLLRYRKNEQRKLVQIGPMAFIDIAGSMRYV